MVLQESSVVFYIDLDSCYPPSGVPLPTLIPKAITSSCMTKMAPFFFFFLNSAMSVMQRDVIASGVSMDRGKVKIQAGVQGSPTFADWEVTKP